MAELVSGVPPFAADEFAAKLSIQKTGLELSLAHPLCALRLNLFGSIPVPGWWIIIPQRRHHKSPILPKHRKQIDCFVHLREFSS